MGSTSDQISGKTNQVIGKNTNNKRRVFKGEIQEKRGKFKHSVKRELDKLID